ncbi:hypothetical protein CAPTEDRAFT_192775 [Capitella teleta]|uniref:Reverse transcriptase/retrotransposon-derived protein RNase H-like domain-containing protein n=1 Tax=Capitella teleta TaxID=283909 RepID=R7T3E8_CAPTE|nr:hypothetical protein CAPTEDRAFT_192775 [Capitella teleta]|eukprot:ELT87257.1 hypothetical protein CAPTEDRAFT_192775 [Capitella teleta]
MVDATAWGWQIGDGILAPVETTKGVVPENLWRRENSFQRIKEILVSADVLAHYDVRRKSIIAADASNSGLGAVLLQEDDDEIAHVQGKKQVIADSLSRAPAEGPSAKEIAFVEEVESFSDKSLLHLPASDHKIRAPQDAQLTDPLCTQVVEYCLKGWPPVMPHQPLLKPYWDKKQHLTVKEQLRLMYSARSTQDISGPLSAKPGRKRQ